ncbi:branched-chain amino acid ABC transporter substrate-binding protein [Caldinitratiruptor microaerophilus]|uniref:Branched chain amino acid ABC transporter substrate-binding protein n=1 Tax=Caldinitratiruptor microaerophilus TaxID=671077 RepID=A0AA35CKK6_9FIRM|nr:branched-chain amino acid ABC transporter substrate-binding protein [Caldinitratiruptor microaerophilus]BDG60932.1 branched chain amino acid ABC transporter substrate-binding protein [Caldinitratiruptor microaerophilus]
MSKVRRVVTALGLAAAVALAAGCGGGGGSGGQPSGSQAQGGGSGGGEAAGTIRIGVQGPLTGNYAYEGTGFVRAITMLADEINQAGGVNGKKIEILKEDDKGDPKEAALAAQKLVSQKVVAVVGSYSSSATEPAQQIYADAGILHITPSSTATKLSEKGIKTFFRTAFIDDAQGRFAANFLVKELGKQKIALVHDNSTYAKGLAEWTKKYVEENGAQVVFFDALNPKEKDFSPLLTKLKGTQPDAIFFTGYFSEGGLLLKQARDLGIEATFAAGNANNNPEFFKIAGKDLAKQAIIVSEPMPVDLAAQNPDAKKFIDSYKQKYGEEPGSVWIVSAADAFRVIVEAITKTGKTDGKALAEYLHTQLKDFPGLTGPINFNEKGDRTGTIHRAYTFDDNGTLVPFKK